MNTLSFASATILQRSTTSGKMRENIGGNREPGRQTDALR